MCCSVLSVESDSDSHIESVAVCCSVLQCVAVCCNVLQCVAVFCQWSLTLTPFILVITYIHAEVTVLQCVAAWCIVLQRGAV